MTTRIDYTCPAEVYHADPAVSNSQLSAVERSPLVWDREYRQGIRPPPTPMMIAGSAIHAAVLEPSEWGKRYACADLDGRSKEGKAQRKAIEESGHVALDRDTWTALYEIPQAIKAQCPDVPWLGTDAGHAEVSFWFGCHGHQCKGRADWVQGSLALDLKTIGGGKLGEAGKIAYYGRWHVQEAMYRAGLLANGIDIDHFIWVVVEREAPYLARTFELEPAALALGQETMLRDLATLKRYLDEGPKTEARATETLALPRWAYYQGDDNG